MAANKAIWLEWRTPITKDERKAYGLTTYLNGNNAKVFINTKLNKGAKDQVKTFWHEMAHVFIAFHKGKRKLSVAREEALAQQIENVIWELVK